MTSISAKAVGRAIAVVLLGALTVTMPASRAQSSNTVNGGAYGAFVQTPAASLARSPFATLDPSGMGDAAAAAVNVASVLASFTNQRRHNVAWLKTLATKTLTRVGVHSEVGPVSVNDLLHEWAFHDLGHLKQILEIKRYGLYPHIGNMQKFYRLQWA